MKPTMNPDEAAAMPSVEPSIAEHSFLEASSLGLLLSAPLLLQIVMFALLIALVWSAVVIGEKLFQFAKARNESDKFEQVFWSGQSLDELYQALSQRRNEGMAALFVAAMREWKRSTEGESGESTMRPAPAVGLRIEKVMDVTMSREMDRLERRLPVLSMIAAGSPLAGLFAFVWGLMVAFQSAAGFETAGLATIAPGIAESLLALAFGLLTAIPAKIFSVRFAAETAHSAARLKSFADEFSAILSRQIDKSA